MHTKHRLYALFVVFASLLTSTSLPVSGQAGTPVNELVRSFDRYRRQSLTEKLFLHTDQSFYLTGETMWFKAFYVDGTFHKSLDLSKVAYVELLDTEGKPVLQTKISLGQGGGDGSLFLPASLNAGTYLMRAYTSWMKNFSADYFFEKTLTIVNPFKPLGLPALTPASDYEVQFFPEGGQLVRGLPGRVAFKITDEGGRGIAVRGGVLNEKNDTLSRFRTHKFGMGTVELTPSEGVAYRVILIDEKGRTLTRPLPPVHPQGYTMRVDEVGANQLKITVVTNVDAASAVYLFAHTRNDIKVAEGKPIDKKQGAGSSTFLLDKNKLGEGITHLTVFDATQKPVCERLYFKRPTTTLAISLTSNQPSYAPRTTVRLDVSASVTTASPTAAKANPANLSVAVYRVDSLAAVGSDNILSYLWMTSDLRGSIESPTYYLQAENADVAQATDNLMLTHGWRRFRWDDVLNPTAQKLAKPFIPEHNGLIVEGTVTDPATGAPVPKIATFLSAPGKPVRLYTSQSNAAGQIWFEMADFYGQRNLIAQTNPDDSLYSLTINNPFSEVLPARRFGDHYTAPFSLDESQANQLLNRSVAMQVQSTFQNDSRSGLPGIQYRYPAVDSAAFYGKPTESYLLDAYTRFPRMEEVLREYVPGVLPRKRQGHFRLFVPNAPYSTLFDIPSLVLIDGVPVFDMDKIIEFSPLKIKQLDVITNQYFMGQAAFAGIISFMTYKGDLAGFPLDTGTAPAGRLLKLDCQGLQLQREFYTPRYTGTAPAGMPERRTGPSDQSDRLDRSTRLPDARTLLYWSPSLKTDAQGKVLVEFPTSDQTGTFVVETNGLTADGFAGSGQLLFEVKNPLK